MEEVIVYQPDEMTRIETCFDGETVWLTQQEIAKMFGRSRRTIGEHVKNAQKEELKEISVWRDFRHTAADGKTYSVKCYNLDAVLSIGYRVKSPRGIQFRQWANGVLKDRITRGNRPRDVVPSLDVGAQRQIESKVDEIAATFSIAKKKILDFEHRLDLQRTEIYEIKRQMAAISEVQSAIVGAFDKLMDVGFSLVSKVRQIRPDAVRCQVFENSATK